MTNEELNHLEALEVQVATHLGTIRIQGETILRLERKLAAATTTIADREGQIMMLLSPANLWPSTTSSPLPAD